VLDDDFLSSGDHQQLNRIAQLLQGLLGPDAVIERDEKKEGLPISASHEVAAGEVERSAATQRYKVSER